VKILGKISQCGRGLSLHPSKKRKTFSKIGKCVTELGILRWVLRKEREKEVWGREKGDRGVSSSFQTKGHRKSRGYAGLHKRTVGKRLEKDGGEGVGELLGLFFKGEKGGENRASKKGNGKTKNEMEANPREDLN